MAFLNLRLAKGSWAERPRSSRTCGPAQDFWPGLCGPGFVIGALRARLCGRGFVGQALWTGLCGQQVQDPAVPAPQPRLHGRRAKASLHLRSLSRSSASWATCQRLPTTAAVPDSVIAVKIIVFLIKSIHWLTCSTMSNVSLHLWSSSGQDHQFDITFIKASLYLPHCVKGFPAPAEFVFKASLHPAVLS